jgi:hypothetical protein
MLGGHGIAEHRLLQAFADAAMIAAAHVLPQQCEEQAVDPAREAAVEGIGAVGAGLQRRHIAQLRREHIDHRPAKPRDRHGAQLVVAERVRDPAEVVLVDRALEAREALLVELTEVALV